MMMQGLQQEADYLKVAAAGAALFGSIVANETVVRLIATKDWNILASLQPNE